MGKNILKIALMQLAPEENMEKNLEKGLRMCRKAKERGADIALFPEMWSMGYNMPEDDDSWTQNGVDADGEFVTAFANLARELNMAIGITYLERFNPAPRNTISLFDRHGKLCYSYSKVHTCDFWVEKHLTPGDDFYTAELDTEQGTVTVGSMICYDREFPESARILMLKGAELVLVPNACPMEINRLSQLRGRAYENMMAIATCNYPSPCPDCNGHSSVFDGVAYLPELTGSRDTCILEAGDAEGVYIGELDLDMLRAYRKSEVHGNAYRQPKKYGLLLSTEIREPFIRKDRRN